MVNAGMQAEGMVSPVLAMTGGILLFLVGAGAYVVDHFQIAKFVLTAILSGAVYLVAVVHVLRRPARRGDLVLILAVTLAARAIAAMPEANLSTDAFRYVWDGRIQAAGHNPYLHVPTDPALAHLRDEAIYPNIYMKERAVTIYPPAAELLFRAAHGLGDDLKALRIVMTALDVVTIGVLMLLLAALQLPRERVLIYAWHPLPMWEFVLQGHIDAAATAAIALGVLAAVHRRQALVGVAFAVATLVKYYPAVLLAALWRRWDWRAPAAFLVTALLLYLPYVLGIGMEGASGWRVLGFLGEHLDNEGYRAGWGFHPIWLLRDFQLADPPAIAHVAVAALLMAAIAAVSLFARGADELRFDRLVLAGAAFVWLASPHYPWYFAFLPLLLALAPSAAVLAMSVLSFALYMPRPPGGLDWTGIYLLVYWLPLVILVAEVIWKRRRNASVGQPG